MKKILIIEDELPYRKILNEQLAKQGYAIIEAQDGKEGLALAKTEYPDLIILDIKLPNMSGTELLDELRKDPYGKKVPVIMLTNLEPDDTIMQKVIADHPSFYFVKTDIQLATLMEKTNSLLRDPFAKQE